MITGITITTITCMLFIRTKNTRMAQKARVNLVNLNVSLFSKYARRRPHRLRQTESRHFAPL